jgi:hypothetical protein
MILTVALYGCEIWSPILKEGCKLVVSENRALRRIFGAKREEVAVGWTRLKNRGLHKLYASPNIVRVIN